MAPDSPIGAGRGQLCLQLLAGASSTLPCSSSTGGAGWDSRHVQPWVAGSGILASCSVVLASSAATSCSYSWDGIAGVQEQKAVGLVSSCAESQLEPQSK